MPRPSRICGIFYKRNATHRIFICCLNLIIFTHIPYIIRRSLLITPPAIILYCDQLWLLLVDSHGKGRHHTSVFCRCIPVLMCHPQNMLCHRLVCRIQDFLFFADYITTALLLTVQCIIVFCTSICK